MTSGQEVAHKWLPELQTAAEEEWPADRRKPKVTMRYEGYTRVWDVRVNAKHLFTVTEMAVENDEFALLDAAKRVKSWAKGCA